MERLLAYQGPVVNVDHSHRVPATTGRILGYRLDCQGVVLAPQIDPNTGALTTNQAPFDYTLSSYYDTPYGKSRANVADVDMAMDSIVAAGRTLYPQDAFGIWVAVYTELKAKNWSDPTYGYFPTCIMKVGPRGGVSLLQRYTKTYVPRTNKAAYDDVTSIMVDDRGHSNHNLDAPESNNGIGPRYVVVPGNEKSATDAQMIELYSRI